MNTASGSTAGRYVQVVGPRPRMTLWMAAGAVFLVLLLRRWIRTEAMPDLSQTLPLLGLLSREDAPVQGLDTKQREEAG